ncbi:NPEPPS [Cordylochernes scorpioides]|uniref:NPEPPS n=1 Tax=Cordylochernes scorpioides TaxID=51811 RepID=A0ABY6LUV4_9ARAC|nr:NPEPPS [Cordylochernes scorpioides]
MLAKTGVSREEPALVKALSGQRVARVVAGANHALALTWDCRVFSWGRNDHGQLGHSPNTSLVLSPHFVEVLSHGFYLKNNTQSFVPGYVQVWDVVAGNTHTLLLGDLHTSHVAMYCCGQHADCCTGSATLQQLNLLKKTGLVTNVFAGGTYSGCLVDHHCRISVLHEFASSERRYLFQLQAILDRLLAGLLREGEVERWWGPLQHLVAVWADLVDLAAMTAYDLTLLVQGGQLSELSLLHSDWLDTYWEFASALGDLTAVGGLGSSKLLSPTLRTLAKDLLGDTVDLQRSNSELLFYVLHIPLRRVGEYVRLLTRLMATLSPQKAQDAELQQMITRWRHVSESINKEVQQAELTAKFWSNSPQKISDALLKPDRRLIRDSKTHPLSLSSPSKFPLAPAHWFILFNDLLVHSHFGAFEVHSLSTIWVESLPDNNSFVLTLPEETLTFNCPSANDKTEWVCVFNQTIRKHLNGSAPRHQDFQSSVPPLSPPLARNATYTFIRHPSFRDATYCGMWLCGKMHGYGELNWQDGKQFVGKFKGNYQHGEGTLKVPHLNEGFTVYEGTWKEGKLNGYGKVTYHNGDVYEGYFQGGLRHGHGTMKQGQFPAAAAQLYIGEWNNNRRQGYGVLDNIRSGEKYMGMWHEDARHGTGMVVTIDGVYYEGNFYLDKLSGHGVMIFEDNTCFEGELGSGGMLNGKGTLYLSNGDKVDGHFAGVWSEGIKIAGTYQKNPGCTPVQTVLDSPGDPVRSKLSTFGQHCVPADQKWEDLFSHCRTTLGIIGVDERTDNARAWEAIAVTMTKRRKQPPKRRWHQKNGCDLLERIPQLSGELTAVEYGDIQRYLVAACDCHHHPLGQLVEGLVDVYRWVVASLVDQG